MRHVDFRGRKGRKKKPELPLLSRRAKGKGKGKKGPFILKEKDFLVRTTGGEKEKKP